MSKKEKFYTIIDGSGSITLRDGKLFSNFPAAPFNSKTNKWIFVAQGNFPSENWNYYHLHPPTKKYRNDVMLVNAYNSNEYLFIERRLAKKIPTKCPTCHRLYN